jgi:hypothetical protein
MSRQKLAWQNVAFVVAFLVASAIHLAFAQQGTSDSSFAASPSEKPYLVEWVYKVKWGCPDEFWEIFKKYQIATLNREKHLAT